MLGDESKVTSQLPYLCGLVAGLELGAVLGTLELDAEEGGRGGCAAGRDGRGTRVAGIGRRCRRRPREEA